MATFTEIPADIANQLVAFIDRRNLGRAIEIDGTSYTLDFISHNTNAFFQSRGLSVYFRAGRSVIRISDHWSSSTGFERSRKLNCGSISGKQWNIDNRSGRKVFCPKYAGRFPFEMLAGRCGLTVLNRECDHWKDARS